MWPLLGGDRALSRCYYAHSLRSWIQSPGSCMCVAWGELGPLTLHCPHVHLTPTGAAVPSLPYRQCWPRSRPLDKEAGTGSWRKHAVPRVRRTEEPRGARHGESKKGERCGDETEPLWGKLEPVVKNRQRKWGRLRRLEPSTGAWPDWGFQAPAEPYQKSRSDRMPGIELRSNSLPSVLSSGSLLQHLTGRSKACFSSSPAEISLGFNEGS